MRIANAASRVPAARNTFDARGNNFDHAGRRRIIFLFMIKRKVSQVDYQLRSFRP